MIKRSIPLRCSKAGKAAVAAIGAGTLLAAAGCSSAGGSGGSSHDAAGLATIHLVYDWSTVDFEAVPFAVGVKEGFYKKQGIQLDLIFPPDNSTTVKMLAVGQGDIGFDTTSDVAFARAANIPIVSIANYSQKNNWGLIAKPGATINPAKLAGKSIGVFTDSWTKSMMPYVLQAAHVSASGVQQVIFQNSDLPAMLSGKIDIATNTTNYAIAQVESATGKQPSVALGTAFGAPNVPIWVYTATSSWLAAHAAQARGFLTATREATQWSIDHPAAAVKDFIEAYPNNGSSERYNMDGWLATIPFLSGSGGLLTQSGSEWNQVVSALKSAHQLTSTFPASTYFTNKYLGN
jgi:ABC-type nitrate/sulfonate/bicarbonate transport system substrate-binding protein